MPVDENLLKAALSKGGAPAKAVLAVREALRLYDKLVVGPLIKRVEVLEAELRELKEKRTGNGK